ncbi:MAG TPA: hypothetical protein VJ824_13025 [Bacillota bacterium]|nr:hypothetical protein [Bacillota bacterium]
MKAFKVFYATGGKETSMIVLAENESKLEEAVAKKDRDFSLGDKWSKINHQQEIPLSNVLIKDLSVTELLWLLKQ